MVIKTTYHFVYSNLNVEISQKRGVNRKRKKVLEVALSGRGQNDVLWGKKGFWGTRSKGKLCRLTIK